MTTTTQPAATLAARFGYRTGAAVRSARARVAWLEAKCVESVRCNYGERAANFARWGSWLFKAATVSTVFLVSAWLALSLLLLLAIAYVWSLVAVEQTPRGDDGPDYLGATSYLGNYDDNGHWIGHMKPDDHHLK